MGRLFTYAAPNSAEGTASGQVSAKQLRHLYRVEKFTKDARIYGVVADPVRHSISPAVHNRAFQARRADAVYLPFLVKPAQLKDFFILAEKLPLAGFSVTIPHKQKILRYLDLVDPLARRIGAVNTVWRKAGKWRGTNTDADGVIRPLERHLRLGKVVGAAGGQWRRGARSGVRAEGSRRETRDHGPQHRSRPGAGQGLRRRTSYSRTSLRPGCSTCWSIRRPLGMFPKVEQSFFDAKIPAKLVFDMVYNPLDTMLVRMARDQGAAVIRGLEMFLEQAAQPVRNLDGRNRSARGDGKSRARSAAKRTARAGE